MEFKSRLRSLLSDQTFALPPERLITFGRLILAAFAVVAIYFDPTASGRYTELIVVAAYLVFALARVAFVMARLPSQREQYLAHAVDIVCVSVLMYLTQGPTSPFFVFFTFILLSATLRWNWHGAPGHHGSPCPRVRSADPRAS